MKRVTLKWALVTNMQGIRDGALSRFMDQTNRNHVIVCMNNEFYQPMISQHHQLENIKNELF